VLALANVVPKIAVLPFAAGVAALQLRDSSRRRAGPPKPTFELVQLQNAIVLGRDVDSGGGVVLTDQQLNLHTVMLGTTGSGKTTTLLTILTDAVRRGVGAVAIDLKGSDGFVQQLAEAARAAGRPFHLWRLDGPGHWNPLAYGDPTELKDKLIGFERFTEPHYQRAAEFYLQRAIQVLRLADHENPVTLGRVVNLLDPSKLQEMLRYVPTDVAGRIGTDLAGMSRDQKSAVMGLRIPPARRAAARSLPHPDGRQRGRLLQHQLEPLRRGRRPDRRLGHPGADRDRRPPAGDADPPPCADRDRRVLSPRRRQHR
jgi:hypothetical protein